VPAVRAVRAALPDESRASDIMLGRTPGSRTFPNTNDALFMFFLGGLYPRRYDKGALNQSAAFQQLANR
jgi:hypothetical protein